MKHALLAVVVVLLWANQLHAVDRVRIGYSSISGAYTPIWVAHEAGYFIKEGLHDDIFSFPAGRSLPG